MNNEVRDGRGQLVGFRCFECSKVVPSMWDETCNECRAKERRHQELVKALQSKDGAA
jgi:DNA-directed RNA polymerase subunit N (RpoN/RPB10)